MACNADPCVQRHDQPIEYDDRCTDRTDPVFAENTGSRPSGKENPPSADRISHEEALGTSIEKRRGIEGQLNLFDEVSLEADPAWKPELPG